MTDKAPPRIVAVVNGKGGVLKTSTAANVAGQMAAAGARVLVVDLDPQANLIHDLGLRDHPADDQGASLVTCVWKDAPLTAHPAGRDRLDIIFGGHELDIIQFLAGKQGAQVGERFTRHLRDLAEDYDLVLLDCPPRNPDIQDMALTAAGYVLIPTKTDAASWDGLLGVGPRVATARETNPQLTYLGVVITDHNPAAKRVLRRARDELAESGLPVLEAVVRHSQAAAQDCRDRGLLAHELAGHAAKDVQRRLAALRSGSPLPATGTGARVATALADDYTQLTREITAGITAVEEA